jgi:hypothetical protein
MDANPTGFYGHSRLQHHGTMERLEQDRLRPQRRLPLHTGGRRLHDRRVDVQQPAHGAVPRLGHLAPGAGDACDAPFTLYNGTVPGLTADLSQRLFPASGTVDGTNWQDIEIITLTGSTLKVELSNDADQYVIADAILIEKI